MARALFVLLLIAGVAAPSARAQGCPPARTALVLSGGGARGLAHIGVFRALDSLGVRPDMIVGTSMGAIVGALYASGYSGRQIDSLARSLPITSVFRTYQPRAPRGLGILQPLLVWEQGEGSLALQAASIRDAEVNALLGAALLRGNLIARGEFDSLPIPFRAVATDLADRSPVVLSSGDLARAARASAAVPLVFGAERIDGRYLADGGLSANLPVRLARALGAERVIVSDVTEYVPDSLELASPLAVADQLVDLLFVQQADSLGPRDVRIRPDIDGFATLNFSPARMRRLMEVGRQAADTALGGARCLRPLSGSSHGFDGAGAPEWVSGFGGQGLREAELRTLRRVFGFEPGGKLDYQAAREGFEQLRGSESYEAVWLNPYGAGDSVAFDLRVRRAPRRIAGLGVTYDKDLGGRAWLGFVDRNLLGRNVDAGAALFIGGTRDELALSVRRNIRVGTQLLAPVLTLAAGDEAIRRFDAQRRVIPGDETRELLGFLGVERDFGRGWRLALGAEGRLWEEPTEPAGRALGGALRLGRFTQWDRQRVTVELAATSKYTRALAEVQLPGRVGPVRLRTLVRAASGHDLPLQTTFQLGGFEGFPGIYAGELRGDRELSAQVQLSHALVRPVNLLLELAGGRIGFGGGLLDSEGWVAGARIGVGARTPIGPVQAGYGVATEDRDAVFLRLLRWF